MKRLTEACLKQDLNDFPCVAITGARQCGKTTLLKTLPADWRHFDLERASDRDLVATDPDLFLRLHPRHIAIDEAQLLPALFPALRVAIDAARQEKGRFVITGSSSPALQHSLSESLAGRLAMIEMAPFAWCEVARPEIPPLAALLCDRALGASDLVAAARPRGTVETAHAYWFTGGYPEPWLSTSPRFRKRWTSQYVQTYLERDLGRLFPGLNQDRFRLFLQLLAGLSGKITNCAELARALGVSQPTARDYLEIAHGTFFWRRLPAFERNAMKRIVKHPRGYVRDSGLLHHLLRIPDLDALRGHPVCGASWEGMAVEELLRQFQALGESVEACYYRTSGGAEVDLVLDGGFGLLPVEVKYGSRHDSRDLRGLRDFVHERGCRLGLVINNAAEPRLLDDRIAGIPFTCL